MARTWVLLFALAASAYADSGYELPTPRTSGYSYDAPDQRADAPDAQDTAAVAAADPLATLALNIPGGGVPGESYPILSSVPDTGFSCSDQEYPGYFADTADEARCQVFHVCQFDGRQDSFLCPNGTVFSQQFFVCDWWFNVDCASSVQYLRLNADIGVAPTAEVDISVRSDEMAAESSEQLYSAPEAREASPTPPTQQPSNQYLIPNRF
ncbi:uncharacterized protein LOC135208235 [Macrobrachium nipponense]|uniref:uncharacterized protein LOC135208235 n=1 Tax=Macrobrachium nipponense TaxID=159736 RepID=UPI0030C85893